MRFVINLPEEDLSSVERICFQVEEAQWFYEDFIRPLDPALPSMSLRSFCLRIFQHCPLLSAFSVDNHMRAFEEFLLYKNRVPVRGAIMLNHEMDSVVLVKGWKKTANWSFPRGKISKDEDDLDCAIREVYEETGFDIRAAGLVPRPENTKFIDIPMREQHYRLYVFRDVPMDTYFEPKTRKEISKIQWYRLSDLPAFRKKLNPTTNVHEMAKNANKFYMVAPFLVPLKKWINEQKQLDASRMIASGRLPQYIDEAQSAEEFKSTIEDTMPSPPDASSDKSALNTMEGATKALQQLLKIQPATQGLQENIPEPNPVAAKNHGNALLELLRGKPQDAKPAVQPSFAQHPASHIAFSQAPPAQPRAAFPQVTASQAPQTSHYTQTQAPLPPFVHHQAPSNLQPQAPFSELGAPRQPFGPPGIATQQAAPKQFADAHRSSLLTMFKSPAAPPPASLAAPEPPKPITVPQVAPIVQSSASERDDPIHGILQVNRSLNGTPKADVKPAPPKPFTIAQQAPFVPPMPATKERSSPAIKPRQRRQRDNDSPRNTPKSERRSDSRSGSSQKPLPGQFRPTAILARPAQPESKPASATASPSFPASGKESPERPDVHEFKRHVAVQKEAPPPKPFAPQILKRPTSQDKAKAPTPDFAKPPVISPMPAEVLPASIIEARKPSATMSPEQKASLLSMFKGGDAHSIAPEQKAMPPAAPKAPEPKRDLLSILRAQAPKKPVDQKNVASPRPDLLSLFKSDTKMPTPEERRASLVNLFKSDATQTQTPEQHKANLVSMFKSAEPTPEPRKASLASLFQGSQPLPPPSHAPQSSSDLSSSFFQSNQQRASNLDMFNLHKIPPMPGMEPTAQRSLNQCKTCGQMGHNSKMCPVTFAQFGEPTTLLKQERKLSASDQKATLLALLSGQSSGSSTPKAPQMSFGNSASMMGQRPVNMGFGENNANPMQQLPVRGTESHSFNTFGQRVPNNNMNGMGFNNMNTNNGLYMNNGMGMGMGREVSASPFSMPPRRPSAELQAQFQNREAYNVDYMRMFGGR